MIHRTFLFASLALACLAASPASAAAQPSDTTRIHEVYDAEGFRTYKLWMLVHRGTFRFRSSRDQSARTDVNREDEVTVTYTSGNVKHSLRLSVRVTFDNTPPLYGNLRKEHEVSNLTIWCVVYDNGNEVQSTELTSKDFILTKEQGHVAPFEPFMYRGLTFTPAMVFTPLRDLAGDDYFFEFDGISFTLTAEL